MPTMKDVYARQAGRLAFGVVLLLGAAHLARFASLELHPAEVVLRGRGLDAAKHLGLTWLAAAVAGAVVRTLAARLPGSRRTEALFARSWAIRSAGAALVLPLTVHMLIFLLVASPRDFDDWVAICLRVTGCAYPVFAVLCGLRAYSLAAGRRAPSPMLIYALAMIVSCVPLRELCGVPPVVVALTTLPILPRLRAMEWRIARERAELAAILSLPRATARLRRANNL